MITDDTGANNFSSMGNNLIGITRKFAKKGMFSKARPKKKHIQMVSYNFFNKSPS